MRIRKYLATTGIVNQLWEWSEMVTKIITHGQIYVNENIIVHFPEVVGRVGIRRHLIFVRFERTPRKHKPVLESTELTLYFHAVYKSYACVMM